jgi:hypothetical protein
MPLRAIAAAMVAKGFKISHEGVAGVLRAHNNESSRLRERWAGGPVANREAELIALAQDVIRRSLTRRAQNKTTQFD